MSTGVISSDFLTSDVAFSSQQGILFLYGSENTYLTSSTSFSSQQGILIANEGIYLRSDNSFREQIGMLPTTITRNIKTIQKTQQWFD